MNIVVTTFFNNRINYGIFTEEINTEYCKKHQYTYFAEKDNQKITAGIEDRSPIWYKPKLILDVFQKFSPDYVLYLDADAIVSDQERKVEDYIDDNFNIIFSDDVGHHSCMNAGVFLIKNCEWSVNFLNEWWEYGDKLYGRDGRDIPIREDLLNVQGYFKGGLWLDQTCLTYMYENIPSIKDNIKIISKTDFNHQEYNDGNYIFHAYAKGHLPYRTLDKIHEEFFRNKTTLLKLKNSLNELGDLYLTDKGYLHNYFNRVYGNLLYNYTEHCDILEIGLGTGTSLMIWKNIIQSGSIHGIDINFSTNGFFETLKKDNRVELFNLDQGNEKELIEFSNKDFTYDIIIDDGSHKIYDQQITLQWLFRNLKSGGYYIIEDLQTSLNLPEYDTYKIKNKLSTIEMLESIIESSPNSDFITNNWKYFLDNIQYVNLDKSNPRSIYCVIRKK